MPMPGNKQKMAGIISHATSRHFFLMSTTGKTSTSPFTESYPDRSIAKRTKPSPGHFRLLEPQCHSHQAQCTAGLGGTTGPLAQQKLGINNFQHNTLRWEHRRGESPGDLEGGRRLPTNQPLKDQDIRRPERRRASKEDGCGFVHL